MYRIVNRKVGEDFVHTPESGMGYQVIIGEVNGKEPQQYVVFNALLLIEPGELEKLKDANLEKLFERADDAKEVSIIELLQVDALDAPFGAAKGVRGPLAPAPRLVRDTERFEGFARVSAFAEDPRIGDDGKVAPGTYATTVEDMRLVPSGFAAAGRYALPNPASARYVYLIVPGVGHKLDGGTVRPANSQAGGGVEVLFVDGAPPGSAFRPYRIPEI